MRTQVSIKRRRRPLKNIAWPLCCRNPAGTQRKRCMAGYVQLLKKYSKAKKWLAKDAWAKHGDPGNTLDQLASMCCELTIRHRGEDWTLWCEDMSESHRATMDAYGDLWMKETGESFMSSAECTDTITDVGIQRYQTQGSPPVHAWFMLELYNPNFRDDDSSA
jgi:hypothetical protein